MNEASKSDKKMDKKEKRKEKKKQKLLAEYELTKANDELKRPGEFLNAPEVKRVKVEPAEAGSKLSPEEFKKLKQQLQERKKYLTNLPRFYLQFAGTAASLEITDKTRVPILLSDVQQLLLYALGGTKVSPPPSRWCTLQKYNRLTHIVALVLEGLSCYDFFTHEHLLPKLTAIFKERVEVFSPSQYGNEVAVEMSCVALSLAQKQRILNKYGSLEAALRSQEIFKVFRALFPINFSETEQWEEDEHTILSTSPTSGPPQLPPEDMFPRTYLLLSLQQMILEDFPLPFEFDLANKYKSYKMTKQKYKEVSVNSPLFALDCEMCTTDQNLQELTHIAIVNEDNETIYETLVKPQNKIVNYLTQWSGITKEKLENVTTTLEDVQIAIQNLLPDDAILVGHSLNCDLHAMNMIHPYVIDTSVIYNMSGSRNKKSKLSALVDYFLHQEIQQTVHNPIEDATATMKLVKLKLAKEYRFGDALTAYDESLTPGVPECQLTASIFNQTAKAKKQVAVVAQPKILETYKSYATGCKPSSFIPVPIHKSKEAIKYITDSNLNHHMTLAHLDLTSKLNKPNGIEKVLGKVDNWCDSIFKNISRNGMCVLIFSGPKNKNSIPKCSPASSDVENDINNEEPESARTPVQVDESSPPKPDPDSNVVNLEISSSSPTPGPDDPDQTDCCPTSSNNNMKPKKKSSKNKPSKRSRHNGVCFVRINTFK